jgi:hypothetical protein
VLPELMQTGPKKKKKKKKQSLKITKTMAYCVVAIGKPTF